MSDDKPVAAVPGDPATKAGTSSDNPDMAAGELAAQHAAAVPQPPLPPGLVAVRDRLLATFPELVPGTDRGELTLAVPAERIAEVLRFCRDDAELSCELLADLSGVHWPAGKRVERAQETTGWPAYEFGEDEGRIELDYLLRSVRRGHRFRLRVDLADPGPDAPGPAIDSAYGIYASADFMEREVHDFFGVRFLGHPNLVRILMPEDWVGHPHRKDYPLGGVEVVYEGATVPPPDQRSY